MQRTTIIRKKMATLFILLLLTAVVGRPAGAATVTNGRDLLILYSNNVHGELEPCG